MPPATSEHGAEDDSPTQSPSAPSTKASAVSSLPEALEAAMNNGDASGGEETMLHMFAKEMGADVMKRTILPIVAKIEKMNGAMSPELIRELASQPALRGKMTSLLLVTQAMQDDPAIGAIMREWSVKLDDILTQAEKR